MISKFQGVILGAAVGDALTAPVQFLSRDDVREQYVEVREMLGGGWLHLRPGQFSDDSQMMVCVLESILEEGAFNVDRAVIKLLQWYKTKPKGIGKTTVASFKRLSKGENWRTASQKVYAKRLQSSAGNGALVRSLPVALRYASDAVSLVTHSANSAMITHADPIVTSGVVLLNLMISELIHNDEKDPRAHSIEYLFGKKNNLWKNILDEIDYLGEDDLIASGFVVDTVQSALWCLLKTGSVEEAVIAAVNCGEDVYALAAVTGALAGAHYGLEGIPSRWLNALEHREAMSALAKRIYLLIRQ
ncbi:MAG: ADP-ribosylglycohydrolase family protein [Acidobacteriia bacterium]|nr:ADP-ribosylglycohydrolase family protein [Terriglobia bacterium]